MTTIETHWKSCQKRWLYCEHGESWCNSLSCNTMKWIKWWQPKNAAFCQVVVSKSVIMISAKMRRDWWFHCDTSPNSSPNLNDWRKQWFCDNIMWMFCVDVWLWNFEQSEVAHLQKCHRRKSCSCEANAMLSWQVALKGLLLFHFFLKPCEHVLSVALCHALPHVTVTSRKIGGNNDFVDCVMHCNMSVALCHALQHINVTSRKIGGISFQKTLHWLKMCLLCETVSSELLSWSFCMILNVSEFTILVLFENFNNWMSERLSQSFPKCFSRKEWMKARHLLVFAFWDLQWHKATNWESHFHITLSWAFF